MGRHSDPSVSIQEYFLDIYQANDGDDGEWIGEYRYYNQLSTQEKASDEHTIKELWTKASTWVASIKNGIMSGDDYRKSESDLIAFTRKLVEGTSPELYQQSIELLNRLLSEGKISRRYCATTNRVFASLHPTKLSTTVAEDALRKVYQYLDAVFHLRLKNPRSLNWYELNQELLGTIQPLLKDVMDTDAINVALWFIYESLNAINSADNLEVREPTADYGEKIMKSSQNQILYGPPGTGKTFHTMEAAVKAAEPYFKWANRDQLKAEYERLVSEKRVRFVTFHQSYGYEEFVEGVKAETHSNGNILYTVKAGTFRQICTDCDKTRLLRVNDKFKSYELIEMTPELYIFRKKNGNRLPLPREVVDSVYQDYKNGVLDLLKPKAEWLSYPTNIEPYFVTGYDSLYKDMFPTMKQRENTSGQNNNYVLIIDEINRGNISKIFGELITLVEPSKRKGAEEALEVTLPYSGDVFSVPDNLYIIGTMNTADRSLALMDTALRRRFDFVEMMPKPELFKNRKIKNIDLTQLLNTLNKRIEVLYDREHTLGHAFFFPVYNEQGEDKAFELLKAAFKNKIIPLLEEYFFDDWNKIRLVLGDNQKEAALCFVTKQEDSYGSLFGAAHGLNTYEDAKITFQLSSFDGNDSVWDQPEAYIAIYTKG
ncbi:hypothetical protein CTM75_19490 [Photobacterium phosphoreum]|nr:hypothetical protein CTM75_19490 [Photobacterium phosphoreum]